MASIRITLSTLFVVMLFNTQALFAADTALDYCTPESWTDCSHLESQFPPSDWNIAQDGVVLTISEVKSSTLTTVTEHRTTACRITKIDSPIPEVFTGNAAGSCTKIISYSSSEDAEDNQITQNDSPLNQCGSIINVDGLSLGEQIPVPGTDHVLAYSSDRTPGFGPNYELSLKRLYFNSDPSSISSVQVRVGGKLYSYDYASLTGDTIDFVWDGKDASGNPVPSAVASIEYFSASNPTGQGTVMNRVHFGSNVPGRTYNDFLAVDTNPAVRIIKPLGSMNPKFLGLGGWTYGAVHFYDDIKKQIFLGNGQYRNAEPIEKILTPGGIINDDLTAAGTPVYVVSEANGDKAYVFEKSSGKHIGTFSALSGVRIESINYDSQGRLQSVVDAFGKATSFNYPSATTVTITAPYGQQTTLTLNSDNQLVQVSTPGSKTYNMAYADGDSDLLVSFSQPNGSVATHNYDSHGLLTLDQNSSGSLWDILNTYSIDGQNHTVQMTTAEGVQYSYFMSYDESSAQSFRRETLPTGAIRQSWRGDNGTTTINREDGTYINYNSGVDPRFGYQKEFANSTTIATQSNLNQLLVTHTRNTQTVPFEFLNVTLNTEEINLNGQIYTQSYDGPTNTLTLTTPEGRQSLMVMDDFNRLVQEQVASYEPVYYNYRPDGKLDQILRGSRITQITYNPEGFVQSVTNPLGQTMTYEYYPDGEVYKQIYPDGREVVFTYDSGGRLNTITPPGKTAHTLLNNFFNLVSTYIAPDSAATGDTTTSFNYDNDGRLTGIQQPGGVSITYYYDLMNQIYEIGTPEGSHSLTYYNSGLVDTVTAPNGVLIDLDYDSSLVSQKIQTSPNMIATIGNTYSNYLLETQSLEIQDTLNGTTELHEVSYGYDNDRLLVTAGDLTIVRNPGTGKVDSTTLDDISESFSYDPVYGELESYSASFQGTLLYSETYLRDDLGRIYQKQVFQNGVTKVLDYIYDSSGRLFETYVDGAFFHRYIYDSNSNREGFVRLNRRGVEKTVSASFDDQDRILSFGNKTYDYENNGDRNQKSVENKDRFFSYNYDSQGALASFVKTRPVVIDETTGETAPQTDSFTYYNDSYGQKVEVYKNSAPHRRYIYNSNKQLIAEIRPNGRLIQYIYGTSQVTPDYMIKNGRRFKLIKDQIGSVRMVVNTTNGNILSNVEYDEFGRINKDTKSRVGFQVFGFAGGHRDPATGLVRFGARDYDPQIGRFTTKDPIGFGGQETNLMRYAANDPVNFIDSTGLAAAQPSSSAPAPSLPQPNTNNGGSGRGPAPSVDYSRPYSPNNPAIQIINDRPDGGGVRGSLDDGKTCA